MFTAEAAETGLCCSFALALALDNTLQMTDEFRWYLLEKKKLEGLVLSAISIFRDHRIEPILIKGWAATRNYPEGKPRFCVDIDLAVSSTDFHQAQRLIREPGSGVKGVDLHKELRHLDTLDWKTLFSNSELVETEAGNIRVLAAEDHLRVLCSHWLTNGGESRDRLWDIVYAVENRPADFDWAKCLDVVSANRRSWILSTIGLAHKYLGLNIEDLPFAAEVKDLPLWLTRCVESGWSSDTKLRGLDESITKPSLFLRQIGKRLPPNPIQATINCEGRFDHGSRIRYQLRDILGRSGPSVRRLLKAVRGEYRWRRSQ